MPPTTITLDVNLKARLAALASQAGQEIVTIDSHHLILNASMLDAVVFKPLPVPAADELFAL